MDTAVFTTFRVWSSHIGFAGKDWSGVVDLPSQISVFGMRPKGSPIPNLDLELENSDHRLEMERTMNSILKRRRFKELSTTRRRWIVNFSTELYFKMADPTPSGCVLVDIATGFVYKVCVNVEQLGSGWWQHMVPVLEAGYICVVTIYVWEDFGPIPRCQGAWQGHRTHSTFNCAQMDCICDGVQFYVFM